MAKSGETTQAVISPPVSFRKIWMQVSSCWQSCAPSPTGEGHY